MNLKNVIFGVLLALLCGCHGESGSVGKESTLTDTDKRQYLLERIDDVAVVQLYADGFDRLALREKILTYHLYQAAVAGRDIFIDQKYAHGLLLRDLFETLYTHREGIDPKTLAAIERYTKLLWINNGPHNPITGRKNVLDCSPEAFAAAVKQAQANGAVLPGETGESAGDLLARLSGILFDPSVDAQVTNKSPGEGQDILAASANNFYRQVTMADLETFEEQYALNSQLVRREDSTLQEIVWRAGWDDVVPAGMYAEDIRCIVTHLEAAIPHATPEMARALGALCHYYRTGNPLDFRAYNVAWVADTDSPVDTINGFIEVYLDPRGQKGAWEGLVYFNDPEKMDMIQVIAENAQWFEDHMPYDPRYRKPEVKGISAKAIQVIIETGDSGPVGPIGINLPNPQDIREQYGSKSVSISNVIEAYDKSSTRETRREFCYTDAEFDRVETYKLAVLDLEVNMHEVIGHASGLVAPTLEGDPEDHIKEYYSALEEARADLVALWFIGDPQLVELGLVHAEAHAELERAAYEIYTRQALSQLRRIREGATIEEDHMRNRQMIVHWLMEHTDAIAVKKENNKTYYVVADVPAWRKGIGRLLKEVQRVKSEGDYAAARALFEAHGIHFDPSLRDEVVRRWDALDQPAYTGFVMPELTAHRDPQGAIEDVTVSYPRDLAGQMLRWSGRRPTQAERSQP
jgi:dipeptidyl-peptidase-3